MRRYVLALALGAVAASLLTPAASATTGCYPACVPPTATLSDPAAAPNQTETVHGSFWCPGTTITVALDGVTVATTTANKKGAFNTKFKLSKDTTSGLHSVTVTGNAFQCTAPGSVSLSLSVPFGSMSATSLTLSGTGRTESTVPSKHGYTFRFDDLGIVLCFVAFFLMLTHKKIWRPHPRRTPMYVRLLRGIRAPASSGRRSR